MSLALYTSEKVFLSCDNFTGYKYHRTSIMVYCAINGAMLLFLLVDYLAHTFKQQNLLTPLPVDRERAKNNPYVLLSLYTVLKAT